MKRLYIYLSTVIALALGSCESELEQSPISEIGSNSFYQNESDFQNAVNGIYSQLMPKAERYFDLSEIRSDNMYATTEVGVREHEPINNFARSLAPNPLIEDSWNNNFNGIMRANTVLDQLSEDVVADQEMRANFEGQAKFLRAFYYFDLVRWYGAVPVFETFVSPEEALEVPQSAPSDVYELIISDLNDAISLLPGMQDDTGRANSWAAKALKAKVHLTRSGPEYGIQGPGLGVNEYDEALGLLNDVINNGPYGWVDNYAEIFAYGNENNADIVFDIQFIGDGLGVGSYYPGYMAPSNYFNAVGIPFPAGLEVKEVSDDLLESYGENDLRREVSVQEGYTDLNGNFDPRPFFRKFLDEEEAGQNRFDWGINYPLIRYTDVLMMKAEAILQGASGSQDEVDEIVNDVRERAGLGSVSGVDLEMLMEERRREFAAEGLRWHDLVRSGLVLEIMNEWLPTEDDRNVMADEMEANWVIYPIPFNQLTVREGLYEQNDGYN
jgi:hypothetical protein